MAEPGLAQRLRRHSRNSGMMIGVSMAAAMIICIAAFIWLYVQLGPLLSDFIPQDTSGDEQPGTIGMPATTQPTPDPGAVDDFSLAEIPPEPLSTPSPNEDDQQNEDDDASEEDDVWRPTHQLRDGPNVNFRSGPNTISEPQGSLAPGTPLRFLDDEEPASGVTWMFFELEDGTEGWIRDIDIVEVQYDDADDAQDADDE